MTWITTPLFPNLVYLVLVGGLWLAALALVAPGTGVLELIAALTLGLAGLGVVSLTLSPWALLALLAGAALFGLSLWRRQEAIWLALSALALTLGSAFLFVSPSGGPAVHPLVAALTSVLTLGYFWLAIRKALASARTKPAHDPSAVRGQVGQVRSALDPIGSVYVGGELWTARAEKPVAEGKLVRVIDLDGLMLTVEPTQDS
jgi:membrane-bound serine protease (ClpP class)